MDIHLKILAISMLLFIANADMVNITVDDMDTSISYIPSDAWNQGQSCRNCSAKLDADRTYQSTWHDGTFFPEKNQLFYAEVNFTGVAVYVYCILSNSLDDYPAGRSDMTFLVDGELSNEFYREADKEGPEFVYNVSVFANTSFAGGEHKLIIRSGRPGGQKAITLLDRIVYTGDRQDQGQHNQGEARQPDGHDSTKLGGILEGTLGGLGCLLLIGCGWIWFRQRQRRRRDVSHVSPFLLNVDHEQVTNIYSPAYYETHTKETPVLRSKNHVLR